jgi:hypothetical protein
VLFTVGAVGLPSPSYAWYFNGSLVSGATNATLELDNVQTNNIGSYYVIVTNTYGSVTSSNASLSTVSMPTTYILLENSLTNFVFQSDSTYYVNSTIQLFGTATIEGGTVIKFDNHAAAQLIFNGPLICRTAIYRPALLTSKNDNSAGDLVHQSTGSPTNYYQATYLVDAA